MSTPVTEAHIARARASGFSTDKGLQMAAQFIANNEAAKAERDQLRAERNNLRADLDAVKSILTEEKDRAERAEAFLQFYHPKLGAAHTAQTMRNECAKLERELAEVRQAHAAEREKAERYRLVTLRQDAKLAAEQDKSAIDEGELKVSRAIVSKIWIQLGSPTYEQLKGQSIYDLIDELKADRARLDWLMAGGVCMVQHSGGFHVSRLHAPVSRAAIDAAMKEGAKMSAVPINEKL